MTSPPAPFVREKVGGRKSPILTMKALFIITLSVAGLMLNLALGYFLLRRLEDNFILFTYILSRIFFSIHYMIFFPIVNIRSKKSIQYVLTLFIRIWLFHWEFLFIQNLRREANHPSLFDWADDEKVPHTWWDDALDFILKNGSNNKERRQQQKNKKL